MLRKVVTLAMSFATVSVLAVTVTPRAVGEPAPAAAPKTYIVTLANPGPNVAMADIGAVAAEQAQRLGGKVGHVYRHALHGYSVELPANAADALRGLPGVASVEEDQVLTITAQTVPTGVRRIFGPDNPNLEINGVDDFRPDVDIAVLDTGIDYTHPDLNVVQRADCTFSASCTLNAGTDGHGHGSHVAGTAAAIDNGVGVVGVAPGARLHAVKVLGDSGGGSVSGITAGIDWVAARASTIEVINMSLGCECSDTAMSTAITNVVNKGVAVVVAAGNSNKNAGTFFPANHPDVITVSALADSDGRPGGNGGAPACRPGSADDTLADFSNWGSIVEVVAPGTCIYSTYKGGGYATLSGTSMASPHVAGAAGLLASGDFKPTNRSGVLAIRQKIVDTGNLNWTDRANDGGKEPLLDVSNVDEYPAGGPTDPGKPRAKFTRSCNTATLTCAFNGTGSSDPDGTIVAWSWDFGDGITSAGATVSHTYAANGIYPITLTVTDNDGKTGRAFDSIRPGPNMKPTADFRSQYFPMTRAFGFASSSSDPDGSIASWSWNFGDGTTGTGEQVYKDYTTVGTYTVRLTVTDNEGGTAAITKPVQVTNMTPTAVISAPCYANQHDCYFNGSLSRDPDGRIVAWAWDFGDGTTGSGSSVRHVYGRPGTFTVTLTVTDSDGATATTTKPVKVP